MTEVLSTLPTTKRNQEPQQSGPTRRQSHASSKSWISSLAGPYAGATTSPPPLPIPTINVDAHSPASTVRLTNMPISRVASPFDPDSESKESTSTHEEKEITHIKYGMSTVDEVSEHATSPMTRVGKARSLVDGLVSGLRGLPRAMTHSQLYDRRSTGRASSHASHFTENRTTMTSMDHDGEMAMALKFPPAPFQYPFVFAPPFMPSAVGSDVPMSVSHASGSKLGSEADSDGSEQRKGRIGNLIAEISRVPWMSTRVTVDYIPGEGRKTSVPTKSSSSWYTITAPATPSDISNPWQTLPEPWFPPTELPTTVEEPEAEERAAEEDKENPEERLREIREELQERSRQLNDLRQVVEHQKMHISALEGELAELRKADEEVGLHRRKSSVHRNTLRARDSLRASRRTSIRVSRPPSSFFD